MNNQASRIIFKENAKDKMAQPVLNRALKNYCHIHM